MAYTPTTWNTGDTITATAMNKIENGIANAGGGGGGVPFYEVTTINFPNTQNWIGNFRWVKKNSNNDYISADPVASVSTDLYMTGNTTGTWYATIPVPTLEDYYLVFFPASSITLQNLQGGIEAVTDSGGYTWYIITGDFSLTAKGWA